MKKPLILFYPNLPLLSKNEAEVLDILIDAGKLIAPIYLEQEKQAEKQINKPELERASKKDPNILSSYTVVEKVNGKLIITPYHVKYKNLLTPVAIKLLKAAKLTKNREFGNALKIQAEALVEGTYDEASVAWLKIKKPYIIDISIGPIDYFADQLFAVKKFYHAWVGILDKEGTERLNNYKSIVLGAERKSVMLHERIDNHDKVKAKVIDVVLFSGLIARTKFVGVNFPLDLNIIEKYGSEVTLFNQPNDLRIKESVIPTFNEIFPKAFKEGFSEDDLRRGYLRSVALHELAHSFLHYKTAAERLQDLFPSIEELGATILGLRMAGTLLLKDRITNKQLESMLVAFICRSYYHVKNSEDNFLSNFAVGGSIFINFMLDNGALKKTEGMLLPNFMKMFVSLQELSYLLENLLALGTHREAEIFIKKYGKNKI